MKKKIFFIAFILFFSGYLTAQDSLMMVYRTTAKEPFISKEPSNDGIWKAVYEQAAKKIGLKLEIKRYPKKRAYQLLAEGKVDFYPASSFKAKREKIGYFINSYLEQEGVTILYRDSLSISSVEDIQGYQLLNNLGSTNTFYKRARIKLEQNSLREVAELGVKRAVNLLQRGVGDVYAYSDIAIDDFLQDKDIKGVKRLEVHSKEKPSVLIFSKKSKYYKEKSNPNYEPNKKLNINNLPYKLDENSIAYKFQKALKKMKATGEIEAILNEHH